MRDPGLVIMQHVVNDPDSRRVVGELPCWHDEKIPYAREIARDIDLPVERLHRILKRLIAGGYATYGPVLRDDSMPIGSSYWLTEQGESLRYKLASGEL
ncbi:hypothetical protein [Novosphingobium clariflavum]|uniref:Uncharacterized protein n=1 Tax=Novosphingobium clariflavum TaxID=2029884 RepID=A0ABV6S604_9SPHN|nr:hypothetical protein [Novosphingobium clariflavum]